MAKFVNEIIYEQRVKVKLSQAELAHQADISQPIIEYLEKGEYEKLPAKIYVKNILNRIGPILHINAKKFYKQYVRELKKYKEKEEQDKYFKTTFSAKKTLGSAFYITPQVIVGAVISLVIIAIVAYLFFQASSLYKAPKLSVSQPLDDTEVEEQIIKVKGQTNTNAKLEINGEEVEINAEGFFEKDITLTEGLNIITVRASSRLDKSTTISRKIIYNPKLESILSGNGQEEEAQDEENLTEALTLKVKAVSSTATFQIKIDDRDFINQVIIKDSVLSYTANQRIELTVDEGSLLELEYNDEALGQFPVDQADRVKVFKIQEENGEESEDSQGETPDAEDIM